MAHQLSGIFEIVDTDYIIQSSNILCVVELGCFLELPERGR